MAPTIGGPAQGLRNAIPGLENLGFHNEVASCDGPSASWRKADAFPLHLLGPGRLGFAYSRRFSSWLSKNLSRFDVVIVHGLWLWTGLGTFLAARRLGASSPRLLLMPHGMLDPWFQKDPSRRLKALRNALYWQFFERHIVNSADAILFTCDEELRLARTTFPGYAPKRELNIGYGVPEPPAFLESMRTAFLEKAPGLKGRPYLLFLGRIHPKKGIDLLIQAYGEILKTIPSDVDFPDLAIAGPGWETPYGKHLTSLIGERPQIHPIGMLEGGAKWGALRGCEGFILPSHQENFGIAVVEALACDKPVLISNKVNIWQEVLHEKAGLVAEDSLHGTEKLLRDFLLNKCLAEHGQFHQCYRKYFGIENAVCGIAHILEESKSWR
jgi:glycosyltransferase involved in cell wall biosynthesis